MSGKFEDMVVTYSLKKLYNCNLVDCAGEFKLFFKYCGSVSISLSPDRSVAEGVERQIDGVSSI